MGRYTLLFLLVAVFLASCLAENDSNNSTIAPSSSTESTEIKNITTLNKTETSLDKSTELTKEVLTTIPTGNATKSTSPLPISTTEIKHQDPMQSEICVSCNCNEGTPFVINCSSIQLQGAFLFPDWPNDVVIYSIEAIFDDNQFDEITQFPELPLLKLSYRGNAIQYIQNAAFKNLKILEYLDLSENKLTHESITANAFEGPFNDEDYEPLPIKTLKLGYNQIHSIDKDAFNHLSAHLEILELNNNPLKIIDHQTSMAITTLRKLKVRTLNLLLHSSF